MNAAPVGILTIRRDSLPLRVRLQLDPAAAAALGWPELVAVELAGRVLTLTPATRATPGARATWPDRKGGGLMLDVRLSVPGRALGRWACYAEAGRLVADLAGPDLGRKAA